MHTSLKVVVARPSEVGLESINTCSNKTSSLEASYSRDVRHANRDADKAKDMLVRRCVRCFVYR